MEQTLAGQVALVTGANRGIGRQISISLAIAGATVVASARNPATLEPVAEEIDKLGGKCTYAQLDVTEESMVRSVIEDIVAQHGYLNLLVNNAGIGAGSQYPWDLPVDEWWPVQEVNVRGAYLCSQAALFRWNSCLADAAKEFGVSVFIISPGLVATDMTDRPQFADIPDDQWVPIEKSGELVVALASGKADKLAGRFIHALDDLDELIANADEITGKNLQALTLNMYNPLI